MDCAERVTSWRVEELELVRRDTREATTKNDIAELYMNYPGITWKRNSNCNVFYSLTQNQFYSKTYLVFTLKDLSLNALHSLSCFAKIENFQSLQLTLQLSIIDLSTHRLEIPHAVQCRIKKKTLLYLEPLIVWSRYRANVTDISVK